MQDNSDKDFVLEGERKEEKPKITYQFYKWNVRSAKALKRRMEEFHKDPDKYKPKITAAQQKRERKNKRRLGEQS